MCSWILTKGYMENVRVSLEDLPQSLKNIIRSSKSMYKYHIDIEKHEELGAMATKYNLKAGDSFIFGADGNWPLVGRYQS